MRPGSRQPPVRAARLERGNERVRPARAPLIAGLALELRRKPAILNATATASTVKFADKNRGVAVAAYCHGDTPDP